jgi:acyl-ACP thioesterase
VRRTVVEVRRPARFFEPLELTTTCVGAGSHSALRRTEVRGALGADADAVTLWVSVEPTGARPRRLEDDFWSTWGASAGGRRPNTRALLAHQVPEGATRVPWTARAADVDSFGHVNNAIYWAALAEATGVGRRAEDPLVAIIEHRSPIPAGADVELWTHENEVWLVRDGTVAASGQVASG